MSETEPSTVTGPTAAVLATTAQAATALASTTPTRAKPSGTALNLGQIQRLRALLREAARMIAKRREGQKERIELLAKLKERMQALEKRYAQLRTQLEYQPQLDLIEHDVVRIKERIKNLESEFI